LGDSDRPPCPAGLHRRQAGGALPGRADVEVRRTDPVPAANREEKREPRRAVVYNRYGPPEVLRLDNVERPVPKEDEVLVKIHATTVTRTDCGWRSATPFIVRYFVGLRRPKRKILGMELAGEVEALGAAVTEFEVGDHVFGVTSFGTHAEFICMSDRAPLAGKPTDMTFEEAAAVCDGASIALSCLRRVDLQKGQKILIYGASGSIGTAAVQLSKYFGADVTAVCNTKNVELVSSLGADEVVDYLQEDFTKNGKAYDVIFDAVGKHSFRRCRRSLKPGGIYLETDLGFMWHVPILALLTRRIGDKKVKLGIAKYTKQDVLFLKELIESGAYRAVIDRCYPLEDVVEATRYVETQQKNGNVVLTVNGGRAR
jgi:NADPH:quinone reductase-like Zn-dependent oxidoreductase